MEEWDHKSHRRPLDPENALRRRNTQKQKIPKGSTGIIEASLMKHFIFSMSYEYGRKLDGRILKFPWGKGCAVYK